MIKLLLLPINISLYILKLTFYLIYIFIKIIIIIFECIINLILGLFTNNSTKHHKEIYITPKENTKKNNTNNKKDTKSYKDIEFDKEAELWGLSKEDKKIAKEERMSPADYIEAEEYDDDNLDIDH